MRGETLKGHLDLLLLATVGDGALHGYAVVEELRRRSDGAFDLPEGTVYPALHRLEAAGLLASEWSASSGRRRRVYRLTTRGGTALATRDDEWRRFAGAVTNVVEGGGCPNPA
ncbi:MAG: helix-turn-helix transcriptional regulator [Actinomycetota bacterium]|nr:helix-turn-helix transcriptional regulator [Actinomycetota bacterium]